MMFDDARLKLTDSQQLTLGAAADTLSASDASFDPAFHGRKRSCPFNNWLPYFSFNNGFVVPAVHGFCFNLLRPFLKWALRKPTGAEGEVVISYAARRIMSTRTKSIRPTNDNGRRPKDLVGLKLQVILAVTNTRPAGRDIGLVAG
jgi:hypothetical protein